MKEYIILFILVFTICFTGMLWHTRHLQAVIREKDAEIWNLRKQLPPYNP